MADDSSSSFAFRTSAAEWTPPAAAALPAEADAPAEYAAATAAAPAGAEAHRVAPGKSKYGGDYAPHASAGAAVAASSAAASHGSTSYLDVLASAPPPVTGSLTHSTSTGLNESDAANFDEIDEAMRVAEFEAFLDEQGVTDEDERARMIVEFVASSREAAAGEGEDDGADFGDAERTEAALTADSAAAAALTGIHTAAGNDAYYAGDAQSAMALLAGGWPSYLPMPDMGLIQAAYSNAQAAQEYAAAAYTVQPLSAASAPFMPPAAAVATEPAAPAPAATAPRPALTPAPVTQSKFGTSYGSQSAAASAPAAPAPVPVVAPTPAAAQPAAVSVPAVKSKFGATY